MSTHESHEMHENSLLAYAEEIESLGARTAAVFRLIVMAGETGIADRTVMAMLGFTDPNSVRPRITELVKQGFAEECGHTQDPVTGKRVRLLRARQVEAAQETME